MKELICILCPRGCRLQVSGENEDEVMGNACSRGIQYGLDEARNPRRAVTSTVRIRGGLYPLCPVKTNGRIPKQRVMDAVRLLDDIVLTSPVSEGEVILSDLFGTGIDFISAKSM